MALLVVLQLVNHLNSQTNVALFCMGLAVAEERNKTPGPGCRTDV